MVHVWLKNAQICYLCYFCDGPVVNTVNYESIASEGVLYSYATLSIAQQHKKILNHRNSIKSF